VSKSIDELREEYHEANIALRQAIKGVFSAEMALARALATERGIVEGATVVHRTNRYIVEEITGFAWGETLRIIARRILKNNTLSRHTKKLCGNIMSLEEVQKRK
jgi:hypothetical protein